MFGFGGFNRKVRKAETKLMALLAKMSGKSRVEDFNFVFFAFFAVKHPSPNLLLCVPCALCGKSSSPCHFGCGFAALGCSW
jgi:hypothetical protein